MFYNIIYDFTLQNKQEDVTKALKEIRELKINYVKKLIPNFTINFNFENETILKEFLEFHDIKPSEKYFEINVKNIISFSNEEVLNYYLKQEIKGDFMVAHFAVLNANKEKERRRKKFIEKFLKHHTQFYIVNEREGCHCLLLFSPDKPYRHNLYLNKDKDSRLNEMLKEWKHDIFYLKNKNPRDFKNVSFPYIKNLTPSSSV